MRILTPLLESRITRDWRDRFPGMVEYKPMHLLRCAGPLLLGIALERDSNGSTYRPTFHVHCLARTAPAITLTLAQPLRNELHQAPESIEVSRHAAKYSEAADRLKRQSPLPLDGDVTLEEALAAYENELKSPGVLRRYQPTVYEDMALVCAWAEQAERAQALVEQARREVRSWPAYVQAKLGDTDAWAQKLAQDCSDPTRVHATVRNQMRIFALEDLPRGALVV
jgi:hypothetical protein